MEGNLFSFVFNTIQQRANNPANHNYWLPGKIKDAKKSGGEPLVPLNETNWNLGAISDPIVTSTFTDQWILKLGRDKATQAEYATGRHKVIPCPDNPTANLSFPAVTINGLHNLFVLSNPQTISSPEGYQTKITLQMDVYNGQNNLPLLPRLSLNGKYRIVQCLCTADKTVEHPTQGDGWQSITIDGTGSIKANFENTYIDADMQIIVQGTGANRLLQVVLTRLNIRGQNETALPSFILDPDHGLTIDSSMWIAQNMWLTLAKNAIESPDGQQAIFQQLNASLNSAGNLGTLSRLFTDQINNMMDNTFGTVPATSLPDDPGKSPANPVDRYIFDRIRAALVNPESQWFLPSVIYNSQNPSLEPLTIEAISLPDQTISIMGEDTRFTQIQITGIQMNGTSNISAPPSQVTSEGSDIKVLLNLSVLNPPPSVKTGTGELKTVPAPPLTATGQFSMVPGDDGGNGNGNDDDTLTGSFGLTIQTSQIDLAIQLAGTVLEDLLIKVTHLQFVVQPGMMALTLGIDSAFKKSIEQVFNGPAVKTRIVSELNNALTGRLDAISKSATDAARKAIATRLDG